MTKKIEKLNKELQSDERAKLLEAANSSAWQEVIKPYLESQMEEVRDVLMVLPFEQVPGFSAAEAYGARKEAARILNRVINFIDSQVIETKSAEEKAKDSFE